MPKGGVEKVILFGTSPFLLIFLLRRREVFREVLRREVFREVFREVLRREVLRREVLRREVFRREVLRREVLCWGLGASPLYGFH